jgi:uncharacterized protein with HEPN domain
VTKKGRIFTDYPRDILEAAEAMDEFLSTVPSREEFKDDRKTVFAVIRAFELMGEATKRVPQPFCRQHPDIPWREMAGMRDKVIHDYFGVDLDVLWKTATEDVPSVRHSLKSLLGTLEEGELL